MSILSWRIFVRTRWLVVLSTAALLGIGCAPHAVAPREFASYPSSLFSSADFRAVSPEGLLFSVRTEKNNPKADLPFWRQAMKTRMSQAGYRILSDTDCVMGGAPAALLKMAAPVGNKDYFYWVALSISGKKILVAEAAGEAKPFLRRATDIAEAISATQL